MAVHTKSSSQIISRSRWLSVFSGSRERRLDIYPLAALLKMPSLEAAASGPPATIRTSYPQRNARDVAVVSPGQTGEEQVPRQKGVMVLSMRDLGG